MWPQDTSHVHVTTAYIKCACDNRIYHMCMWPQHTSHANVTTAYIKCACDHRLHMCMWPQHTSHVHVTTGYTCACDHSIHHMCMWPQATHVHVTTAFITCACDHSIHHILIEWHTVPHDDTMTIFIVTNSLALNVTTDYNWPMQQSVQARHPVVTSTSNSNNQTFPRSPYSLKFHCSVKGNPVFNAILSKFNPIRAFKP